MGVGDFGIVRSGVVGGVLSLSGTLSSSLLRTNGLGLSAFFTGGSVFSTLSVWLAKELTGVGGAVLESAHAAGAVAGEGGAGSFAGVDRLHVSVVVSLEGLSCAGSRVAVAVLEESVSSARAAV